MISNYSSLEKVAESSRCDVYQAFDVANNRKVLLKCAKTSDGLSDLNRECKALSAIKGERVVRILEASTASTLPGIALEWIDGETLEKLAERSPLLAPNVQRLVLQSLEALASVHRAGYLHRDVTPANLMESKDGGWKLIDFGAARPMQNASDDPLVGSVYCMAPEQFDGSSLDARTDLYGLGCSLFYALTGIFAHLGASTPEVIASHLNPELPDIGHLRPDLRPEVSQLIKQLLSRRPEDRPASAEAALQAVSLHHIDNHG